ncbi:hypothetical protein [Gluconobacter japonicus]|uniref:Uncharacterized protein n=1 Tax=Gluconobacter japonicus TaxID=376620 RepID=A0A9Q2FJY4_GLUJA|nr:hypothetical protein [Gluconobacter japonicus]MBF0869750.1 hypothetical protein [Gluconobacter japonicus]
MSAFHLETVCHSSHPSTVISFDVAKALIILRRNMPDSFHNLSGLKLVASRAYVPVFVILGEADHWDMVANYALQHQDALLPNGIRWAFVTVFRDIANTWRCRAPSRQLTHDLGAAA